MELDFSQYSLTYKEIKQLLSEQQILEFYFPEIILGKKNHSPFRVDNNPSFLIKEYPINGIHWKDMKSGETGNLYDMLMAKLGSDFKGILVDITQQMILKNKHKIEYKKKEPVFIDSNSKETFSLGVKRRAWMDYDIDYWKQFGIFIDTLTLYNVSPIEYIFIANDVIKCDKYAYVYKELKDEIVTLKTYQPFAIKNKWFTNANSAHAAWEGWTQLPATGDLLIWTKSRKDLMSIYSTTGIPAVSLQAESIIPKQHVVNQLKERFKKIVLLYDNDYDGTKNWGRLHGEKMSNMFDIPQIEIPSIYQSKDYSSLYQNHGIKAIDIINNLIC
jgi:hypothetical protein